jgi:hypothetical protein
MAMNVISSAVNWSAAQNHSEPGPKNAIPLVLMIVTPIPSVVLARWRDNTKRRTREQHVLVWS